MRSAPCVSGRGSIPRCSRALVSLAFCALLVGTAWVCDDAYISLRVVDNFVSGLGLRWNADERVQVYTHPLWLLCLSPFYALTREAFLTTIAVSIATSSAGFLLCLTRLARSPAAALFLLLCLGSSKAFVDYSTSGLENPLLHALLFAFCAEWSSARGGDREVGRLALLASCIGCTRLDALLLVLPALAQRGWRRGSSALLPLARGFLPLLAWELFALVYYGSLVPNTALAKLSNAVPSDELRLQGLAYLVDSLRRDPITLASVAAALLLCAGGRGASRRALLAGVLAYTAYVVSVGGDYMSGRFLSAPLAIAVCILVEHIESAPARRRRWALAWPLCLALGSDHSTWASPWTYGQRSAAITDAHGISDERRYYYPHSNAIAALCGRAMPDDVGVSRGRAMRAGDARYHVVLSAGFSGYWAGPERHLIDRYALCDAFLARLPPLRTARWRPGHFLRWLPPDYYEGLCQGRSLLADPGLSRCLADVELLTRAPLFDLERWRAILRQGLGLRVLGSHHDHLRYANLRDLRWAVNAPLEARVGLGNRGLSLRWRPGALPAQGLVLELEGPGELVLEWLAGVQVLGSVRRPLAEPVTTLLLAPPPGRAGDCDGLRILPRTNESPLALLGVRTLDEAGARPLEAGFRTRAKRGRQRASQLSERGR